MSGASRIRRGHSWRTMHEVDANEPRRPIWLAQPTICGLLRKDAVKDIVALNTEYSRMRKCAKCVALAEQRIGHHA